MIDYDRIRMKIAEGISDYIKQKVIRASQTGPLPAYPFLSYNIITPASQNNGTYEILEDGTARKLCKMTFSFTSHSDDFNEAMDVAYKSREWLDHVGTYYLADNDIDIHSVTQISDRSNLLTIGYEYACGFDCVVWVYDEISIEPIGEGEIKTTTIGETQFVQTNLTANELNERLKRRLDGDI